MCPVPVWLDMSVEIGGQITHKVEASLYYTVRFCLQEDKRKECKMTTKKLLLAPMEITLAANSVSVTIASILLTPTCIKPDTELEH